MERRALRCEGCVMKSENIELLTKGVEACAGMMEIIRDLRAAEAIIYGRFPGGGKAPFLERWAAASAKAVDFVDGSVVIARKAIK